MAKKADTKKAEETKRGRKVMLTPTLSRVDFIRRRYYDEGLDKKGERVVTRGMIVKELKEKYDHEVPYQIVFAATKTDEKPEPKATTSKTDDDGAGDDDNVAKKKKKGK